MRIGHPDPTTWGICAAQIQGLQCGQDGRAEDEARLLVSGVSTIDAGAIESDPGMRELQLNAWRVPEGAFARGSVPHLQEMIQTVRNSPAVRSNRASFRGTQASEDRLFGASHEPGV